MPRCWCYTTNGNADSRARAAGELGEHHRSDVPGHAGIEHEQPAGIGNGKLHESGGNGAECKCCADLHDGDFSICGHLDRADGIASIYRDPDRPNAGDYRQFDENCDYCLGERTRVWDWIGECKRTGIFD